MPRESVIGWGGWESRSAAGPRGNRRCARRSPRRVAPPPARRGPVGSSIVAPGREGDLLDGARELLVRRGRGEVDVGKKLGQVGGPVWAVGGDGGDPGERGLGEPDGKSFRLAGEQEEIRLPGARLERLDEPRELDAEVRRVGRGGGMPLQHRQLGATAADREHEPALRVPPGHRRHRVDRPVKLLHGMKPGQCEEACLPTRTRRPVGTRRCESSHARGGHAVRDHDDVTRVAQERAQLRAARASGDDVAVETVANAVGDEPSEQAVGEPLASGSARVVLERRLFVADDARPRRRPEQPAQHDHQRRDRLRPGQADVRHCAPRPESPEHSDHGDASDRCDRAEPFLEPGWPPQRDHFHRAKAGAQRGQQVEQQKLRAAFTEPVAVHLEVVER